MHKPNNYLSKETAQNLAIQGAYFERIFPNKGGIFKTNLGEWKVNEKTFKAIQQHLKPRN